MTAYIVEVADLSIPIGAVSVEVPVTQAAPGPAGPANMLTVGTVTTGAPGSAATAQITGAAPAQTLNLTIPRGEGGAAGAPGAAGPAIDALLTTKGDLAVRDAANAVRLPIGENGAALVADSTAAPGMRWSTVRYVTGTGFPEGVVTAPVGSRYVDTATTNGAVEWIKASGVGNTGWRVSQGDTGIRNVSSLLLTSNGYTGGYLTLRRIGSTCYFAAVGLTRAAVGTGYQRVINLPAGFGIVSQPCYIRTLIGSAFGYVNGNEVTISGPQTTESFSATWLTDATWPSTLPGV